MANKKECSNVKKYYDDIMADYREFFLLYPQAMKQEKNEEVMRCRQDALALGAELTKRLGNSPIDERKMKDIKIKNKIEKVIDGIVEGLINSGEDDVRRENWEVSYFVKNGVVHFRGLGDTLENLKRRTAANILTDSETPVEILDLSNEKIREADFAWLIESLEDGSNKVRVLRMSGNPLGNPGAFALADVLKNENCKIRNLQLDGCKLENEGVIDIIDSMYSTNCRLRVLNLADNGELGQDVIAALTRVLKDKRCDLRILDLSSNDLDLSIIIELLSSFENLTELNLSATQLFDKTAILFSAYYKGGNLKKLILSDNPGLSLKGQQAILDAIKREGTSLEVVF